MWFYALLYQPFKLWNPFKITDHKTGAIIADIWAKRRSKRISALERKRRTLAGEEQKQWFSCKRIRSLDMSGGEN